MTNMVILIGNLGKDPEVGRTKSGDRRYLNLRVATSYSWKDRDTGERKEKTEWHSVVVWNENTIAYLEKYAKKGNKVEVHGKVETRSWDDKTGQKRYSTEVVVQGYGHSVGLVGSNSSGGREGPDGPVAGQSYMRDDDRVPDHDKNFDYGAEADKRGFNDEIPF